MLAKRGGQLLDDVALVGQRPAEIAVQDPEQPGEVADIGRACRARVPAEHPQGVGGRLLPEDGGGDVPGRICVQTKISTETARSVNIPSPARVAMSRSTEAFPSGGYGSMAG